VLIAAATELVPHFYATIAYGESGAAPSKILQTALNENMRYEKFVSSRKGRRVFSLGVIGIPNCYGHLVIDVYVSDF